MNRFFFLILSVLLLTAVSYVQAQGQAPVTVYVSQTTSETYCETGLAYRWQFVISQPQLDTMSGDYLVNVRFGGESGFITALHVQDGRAFAETDGGRWTFCAEEGFPAELTEGHVPSRAAVMIYQREERNWDMLDENLIFDRNQAPVIEQRLVFEPQNGEEIELVLWEIEVPTSMNCDSLYGYALRISEQKFVRLDTVAQDDHIYAVLYNGINFAGVAHLWMNEHMLSENGGELCFHGMPPTDGMLIRISFEEGNPDTPFSTALVEITVLQ